MHVRATRPVRPVAMAIAAVCLALSMITTGSSHAAERRCSGTGALQEMQRCRLDLPRGSSTASLRIADTTTPWRLRVWDTASKRDVFEAWCNTHRCGQTKRGTATRGASSTTVSLGPATATLHDVSVHLTRGGYVELTVAPAATYTLTAE